MRYKRYHELIRLHSTELVIPESNDEHRRNGSTYHSMHATTHVDLFVIVDCRRMQRNENFYRPRVKTYSGRTLLVLQYADTYHIFAFSFPYQHISVRRITHNPHRSSNCKAKALVIEFVVI